MHKYTLTSRLIHWFNALLVFFMFISGWYMVELDYYSNWYNRLPELHYGFGLLLMMVWLIKIIRLFFSPDKHIPRPNKTYERILSKITQNLFYLFIITLMTTGYLMVTAEGDTKTLFGFIKLPALTEFSGYIVDNMGWIHKYGAYVMMAFVALHAIGAVKHHVIDKDDTLKRMI